MMNGADRIEFTDVEVVDGGILVLKCRIGGKIVYVPALRMLPGSTIHRYRGGNWNWTSRASSGWFDAWSW